MSTQKRRNVNAPDGDKLFESQLKQKQNDAAGRGSKAKEAWKDISRAGPVALIGGLVVVTVLLTVGGAFYEEASDDEVSHYEVLGVKRMAKAVEIQVAYDKLQT